MFPGILRTLESNHNFNTYSSGGKVVLEGSITVLSPRTKLNSRGRECESQNARDFSKREVKEQQLRRPSYRITHRVPESQREGDHS